MCLFASFWAGHPYRVARPTFFRRSKRSLRSCSRNTRRRSNIHRRRPYTDTRTSRRFLQTWDRSSYQVGGEIVGLPLKKTRPTIVRGVFLVRWTSRVLWGEVMTWR